MNYTRSPMAGLSEAGASRFEPRRPNARLLDVGELAEYLRVPVSWIYDNHRALGLPAIKVGRYLRFRTVDVDAWLDTRKRVGP
jgi:excisionase family DNA binding protein